MAKFELNADLRDVKGKGASRRLRRDGKVPAVMYGAGKEPVMLTLDHNTLYHQVKNEAFYSSILTVKAGKDTEQAVLRDIQMHPYKPRIAHLDLQRISATEKLHMRVPLHFINQDTAPGVKQQGGIVTHLMSEVDITCLPKDLPEFLTVDMGGLSLNQAVHLSDLKLPEGVTITSFAHGGGDLAVANIMAIREEVEEAPVAAAAAEGAAAPAAEGAKPEAGKAEAGKAEPAKKEGGKK
ncbi:MAG: 50S ribosomal protein L25/general stress protein Ctc [Gammaproteobacteria bacterium]|nr:50S ribosomal protein L25/general stress protein Ctc [Gammaproteobacteria bacterium]